MRGLWRRISAFVSICFTTLFTKLIAQILKHVFAGTKEDVTEENIQSRARGTLLMALSNKFGDRALHG